MQHDGAVQRYLDAPGAPAVFLLQVQHQHVKAAQAGLVPEQNQHARAHEQAADEGRGCRVQVFKAHPLRQQVGEYRQQCHRHEGLER